MIKARGQAERYVRALPPSEPNPPFLLVVDVGHNFEVFADFTQAGKAYLPFPDPRTFRIRLEHLADEKVRERLKLNWPHPSALDPALQPADVTREISAHLAELAKSLGEAGDRRRDGQALRAGQTGRRGRDSRNSLRAGQSPARPSLHRACGGASQGGGTFLP
jgi:hypothetical protein